MPLNPTKIEVINLIAASLADNTSELITPALHRAVCNLILDYAQNFDNSDNINQGSVNLFRPPEASQPEAEEGTEAAQRSWSPLRIAQAIAALSVDINNVFLKDAVSEFVALGVPTSLDVDDRLVIEADNDGGAKKAPTLEEIFDFFVAEYGDPSTWSGAAISQAEAEAGAATNFERKWSAERVKQAIIALTPAPTALKFLIASNTASDLSLSANFFSAFGPDLGYQENPYTQERGPEASPIIGTLVNLSNTHRWGTLMIPNDCDNIEAQVIVQSNGGISTLGEAKVCLFHCPASSWADGSGLLPMDLIHLEDLPVSAVDDSSLMNFTEDATNIIDTAFRKGDFLFLTIWNGIFVPVGFKWNYTLFGIKN